MTFRAFALISLLGVALGPLSLSALGRSEGSIQKTWDYPEGLRTLIVDADRHDIVLKAGGPHLAGRLVGDSGDVLKTEREGDTLTITARTDRSWVSWIQKTARIEITLPPGLNVQITTASGSVRVQVATNGLVVRTASGDIEALRGGTSADVDAASGDIRLKGFEGPVRASVISGDLHLDTVGGVIQAASMSGDINATNVSPADKSRFSTVSGDNEVSLAGGPERYLVRAETVSGDVSIGDARSEKKLSAGSGPLVTVKAVSGDVRVK